MKNGNSILFADDWFIHFQSFKVSSIITAFAFNSNAIVKLNLSKRRAIVPTLCPRNIKFSPIARTSYLGLPSRSREQMREIYYSQSESWWRNKRTLRAINRKTLSSGFIVVRRTTISRSFYDCSLRSTHNIHPFFSYFSREIIVRIKFNSINFSTEIAIKFLFFYMRSIVSIFHGSSDR